MFRPPLTAKKALQAVTLRRNQIDDARLKDFPKARRRLHGKGVRAAEKGVAFNLGLSEAARGQFLGDGLRLQQVLANLLSNAIKFTSEGEVSLTVDVEPAALTQSVWSSMHGLVSLLIAKPAFPWVEREKLISSHLRLMARGVWKAP